MAPRDDSPVMGTGDGSPGDKKMITTIVVVVCVSIVLTLVAYGIFHFCRRRSNRRRAPDIEDGSDDGQLSLEGALQDLEPPGGFRGQGFPRALSFRRTLNRLTAALSSNPPTQADIDTARRGGLSSVDGGHDNDADGIVNEVHQDPYTHDPSYEAACPTSDRLACSLGRCDPLTADFYQNHTHASLVPEPLNSARLTKRTRHGSLQQSPSSSMTVANGQLVAQRPASLSDVDGLEPDPEIIIPQAHSFIINDWPVHRPTESPDPSVNATTRNIDWHTPPPEETIERSRNARERLEWEEAARQIVLQRARDAEEWLSDEEVSNQVQQMYQRSSRYRLEPNTYDPATPLSTSQENSPLSGGRDRRDRSSRVSSGALHPVTNLQAFLVTSQEPALASSQVLPLPSDSPTSSPPPPYAAPTCHDD